MVEQRGPRLTLFCGYIYITATSVQIKEHVLKTDRLSTAKCTDKATIKRVERMNMEWKAK